MTGYHEAPPVGELFAPEHVVSLSPRLAWAAFWGLRSDGAGAGNPASAWWRVWSVRPELVGVAGSGATEEEAQLDWARQCGCRDWTKWKRTT